METKRKISLTIVLLFSLTLVFSFSTVKVSATSFGVNLLVNPGAEAGLYGWTQAPTKPGNYTWQGDGKWMDYVRTGNRSFRAGDSGDGILYQDVDISDESNRISRGELKVRLTGHKKNYGDGDRGRIRLQALGANGSVI